ncbi:solute symporter family protein [Desulforegula conservatrix]|uniref:solute symporter family protein n=1 Tax=Desulforegula conservatrix TaxID=153026 RepID=UPI00041E8459|nr:cation acetate symporter [Desulforegula conservatrix]
MIYDPSPIAVGVFLAFVIVVVGVSKYLGAKTTSAEGYFAAGGTVHWGVNGIAFAGDYLSAASFLGICGMIAFSGYDGFLYSIGYLGGWVVAMFVVAEPMKRAGKYTFTDALDSKFNSKAIQLMAAISTLVVSVCYLIPQMVGAGDLITPLLGLPHWVGVVIVGCIVTFIVATAGMASTTYVQFLKGALLIIFSTILTVALLKNGFNLKPSEDYHKFLTLNATVEGTAVTAVEDPAYKITAQNAEKHLVKLEKDGVNNWWEVKTVDGKTVLKETLSITDTKSGVKLYNGETKDKKKFFPVGGMTKIVVDGKEVEKTGAVGPFEFLETMGKSEILRFKSVKISDGEDKVNVFVQNPTPGSKLMRTGAYIKVDEGSTIASKLNFVSLMLALFFGTAALPHILIRYYTVPSPKDARKSTIVAIVSIGFFYILTLYMGLGAMTHGVLDMESSNMSAPLLAKYFGVFLFAAISAIAFSTVLGTVAGLIVAASGAVAHDVMTNYLGLKMTDSGQVKAGKIAAAIVGVIAIILGIIFKGMNVSFLVGLAFAIASSANLPSIMMMLFWKRTSAMGISCSIFVGMTSAIGLILLSPSMWERYGYVASAAPFPLDNPGIVSIPLSFLTLIVVSLILPEKNAAK